MSRECAICMGDILRGQETFSHAVEGSAMVHEFHKMCMSNWITGPSMASKTKVKCPTCRVYVGEKDAMIEEFLGRDAVRQNYGRVHELAAQDVEENELAQMGNEQARQRLGRRRMGIPPAFDVPLEVLASIIPVHGQANRDHRYDYSNAFLYGFHIFGTRPLFTDLAANGLNKNG